MMGAGGAGGTGQDRLEGQQVLLLPHSDTMHC